MTDSPRSSTQLRRQPLSNPLKHLWRRLWQTLCLMCGQWVRADAPLPALCHYCLETLPWICDPCPLCALPLTLCQASNRRCADSPFATAVCPLLYHGHAARWVLRSKRSGGLPEARLLGSLLTLAVRDCYGLDGADPDSGELPELLLPVPLSWQRQLQRGHNQAQWIAAEVAAQLRLDLDVRTLRRHRHSAIQPGLSPEGRHANVAQAFVARRSLQAAHVAIVDDVMTSGATAAALSRCLLDAGCARVDVWCATRALPS